MKNLFSILGAISLCAFLFSCSGGTSSKDAKKSADSFIKQAEEITPLITCDKFGEYPSICAQSKTADSLVEVYFKEKFDKLKIKDEKDLAKLTKYEEEATEEGDAIDADLKTYYENKKAEAIKKISGTEIPCISSDDLISSGKAVIGTGKSGDFVISFTIVLNKDLKPIAPFISYKYFNAEGEVLSASTQYFEPGEYKIGDTLEFDEPISNKKFLCKIKEINFMN